MFFAYQMLAAAMVALSRTGALKPEPPFHALAQMSGANSSVEIARVTSITSQPEWIQLWREHHSSFQVNAPAGTEDRDPDRPVVDFNANAVLCMFGGQSKNVGAFTVVDSGDSKGVAYIRISPSLLPDSGTTILQNPFIFVIVPKTKRKIVVQLDQTPLGGVGWRTLATIGPTKN